MTTYRILAKHLVAVTGSILVLALHVSPATAFVAANAEELQRLVNDAHARFRDVKRGSVPTIVEAGELNTAGDRSQENR